MRALAKRDGINQKTVAKWKKRTAVKDLPTGPKDPHSTMPNIEDETVIVAFRHHTLLPLDDYLYALPATIPNLRCTAAFSATVSADCDVAGDKPAKRKFKPYPIGYFHVDIPEVQTAEGKLRLSVSDPNC